MVVSELAKRDLNCSGSAEPPRFRNETKPHIIASDGTGLPLQFCVAACSPRKRFRRSLARSPPTAIDPFKTEIVGTAVRHCRLSVSHETSNDGCGGCSLATCRYFVKPAARLCSRNKQALRWLEMVSLESRRVSAPGACIDRQQNASYNVFFADRQTDPPTNRSINRSRPGGYVRSGGDGGRLSVTCWAATSSSTPPPASLFDAALWISAACFDCFG